MESDAPVAELTTVIARIHGMLLSEENAAAAVARLAQVARDLLPAAAGAGVSLIDDRGRRVTTAATDTVVLRADSLQYELSEGPCLSAWASQRPQSVTDTAADTRWPHWCAAVVRLGLRSVLSVPLEFRGQTLGALKVYAFEPQAFPPEEERRLARLAVGAATLLGSARTPDAPHRISASLREALEDRRAVEMATGVLMERHGEDQAGARHRLLRASREQGRPLTDVARRVVQRAGRRER